MSAIAVMLVAAWCPCVSVAQSEAASQAFYHIHVDLRPDERRISVVSEVTLSPTGQPRTAVEFALRSDMGVPQVEVLSEGVSISRVEQSPHQPGDGVVLWRAAFANAGAATEPVRLRIRCGGVVTASLNFWIGQDFAVAGGGSTPWYPQVGGGRGRGSLEISAPRRYFFVATGVRGNERVRGDMRVSRFESEQPTQFGFVASRHRPVRVEGRVPISVYAPDSFVQRSELAHIARSVIDLLEHEFGPYPFKEFAVIEAPTEAGAQAGFLGAAFDGFMVMRSDFLETKGADVGFFGHEIGHQWWGVAVTSAGRGGEYMLDEAIANYGALRAVEALGRPSDAQRFRAGTGGLGGARHATRLVEAGFDAPLANLPRGPGYYGLSDSKGYLVYDMLAQLIGQDRMAAALTSLYREHAFSEIDWSTFEQRLRDAAGPEHAWFFDQWFHRNGLPTLSHQWRWTPAGVVIYVQQAPPLFRMELPVQLTFDDGSAIVRTISIAQASTQAWFSVDKRVINVELDPMHSQLWTTPEQRSAARAYAPVTRGQLLWDNGDTPGAVAAFQSALTRQDADPTPTAFSAHVFLGWIAAQEGDQDQAIMHNRRALSLPVRDGELLARAYFNLARALSAQGDAVAARNAAGSAIAAERSNSVHTRISAQSEAILAASVVAR